MTAAPTELGVLAALDGLSTSLESGAWDVAGRDRLLVLREARAAVADVLKYGNRIEQRRRGMVWGDADAEAQDWAEFRAAIRRAKGGCQ